MNIHTIFNILLPPFRKRRMREFIMTFAPSLQTRILDVGGYPLNWNLIDCRSQITLLNLSLPQNIESEPDQTYFCTCYGATEIASNTDGPMSQAGL